MPYKCDVIENGKECGRMYEKPRGLSAHRALTHGIHDPIDERKVRGTLPCPKCKNGKLYSPRGLGAHNVVVHDMTRNKNLRQLPGVGDLTEATMRKQGIDSIERVAVFRPEELAAKLGISVNFATQMIEKAKELNHFLQGKRKSSVANREKHAKHEKKKRKERIKERMKKWEVSDREVIESVIEQTIKTIQPVTMAFAQSKPVVPEPAMVIPAVETPEPLKHNPYLDRAASDPSELKKIRKLVESIGADWEASGIKKDLDARRSKFEVFCIGCGWVGKSASLRLRWKSPTSDPYPVCPTCESSGVHEEA